MTVQCAISGRPLTIDDLPEVIPAVLEPCYDQQVPAVLGGRLITLPEQMPARLPARTVQQVAAALAAARRPRSLGSGALALAGAATARGTAAEPVPIDEVACGRLLGYLAGVGDRRDRRGVRYPLPYLLALPIVAQAAGEADITAVGEWVAGAPEQVLLALGAPVDAAGVVRRPEVNTLTDALALHAQDYDQALCAWAGASARDEYRQVGGGLRRCLRIDGKAVKGAARGGRVPMLLSARFDDGLVAAQRPVPVGKTNEITVFAPLLDQIPDAALKDVVVTADQLHTQRGHATYLHQRGAEYVFTVGGNQKRLYQALDDLPWAQIAVEAATVDRGHGRIEIRTICTLPPTEEITGLFPHIGQVFLLERYVYDPDGKPLGAVAVLGITSLPGDQADGEAILAYVRGHWSIESLHWLRDQVFGEDNSRMGRAWHAMAAIRNLIIGICHRRGITQISRQLRQCGRDCYQRPLTLLGLTKPTRAPAVI